MFLLILAVLEPFNFLPFDRDPIVFQTFKAVVAPDRPKEIEIKQPNTSVFFKMKPGVNIEAFLVLPSGRLNAGAINFENKRFGFFSGDCSSIFKLKSSLFVEIDVYIIKNEEICDRTFFSTFTTQSFVISTQNIGNVTTHGETICFIHCPPIPLKFSSITVGSGFLLEYFAKNSFRTKFFSTSSYHNVTNPYAAFAFTQLEEKTDGTFTYLATSDIIINGITTSYDRSYSPYFFKDKTIELIQIPDYLLLPPPTPSKSPSPATPTKSLAKTEPPRTADVGGDDDDDDGVEENAQTAKKGANHVFLISVLVLFALAVSAITMAVIFIILLNRRNVDEENIPLISYHQQNQ